MSMWAAIKDELDPETRAHWTRMSADSFYSSVRWLEFVAENKTAWTGWAVAGDSVPVVGVPVAHVAEEDNSFYRWEEAAAAQGVDVRPGSRLLLGPRRGYQTHILTLPDAPEDRVRSALNALVARLRQEAGARGLDGLVAMYADTVTAERLRRAAGDATVLHLADDAWIDLPGTTFDDYLAGLSAHRRRRVIREMRAIDEIDVEVDHRRLADVAHDVAPLLAANQARHGHPADAGAIARSLARQGELFGDQAEVLTLSRAGSAVAFIAFYCHGETLFLRATGSTLAGAAAYINLVYYLPARLAYARGLRRVHAGILAAETKALRGASIRPTWLVDLAERPLVSAEHAAAANRRLLEERAASPILTGGLSREEWRGFV